VVENLAEGALEAVDGRREAPRIYEIEVALALEFGDGGLEAIEL